jgi:hypothetical protein
MRGAPRIASRPAALICSAGEHPATSSLARYRGSPDQKPAMSPDRATNITQRTGSYIVFTAGDPNLQGYAQCTFILPIRAAGLPSVDLTTAIHIGRGPKMRLSQPFSLMHIPTSWSWPRRTATISRTTKTAFHFSETLFELSFWMLTIGDFESASIPVSR